MMPRTDYEMSEAQLAKLLDACKPVPVMMIGGSTGPSTQQRANAAWEALGREMGFDHMTVRPAAGRGQRFFTAVPTESAEAKREREAREQVDKDAAREAELKTQIEAMEKEIGDLRAKRRGETGKTGGG